MSWRSDFFGIPSYHAQTKKRRPNYDISIYSVSTEKPFIFYLSGAMFLLHWIWLNLSHIYRINKNKNYICTRFSHNTFITGIWLWRKYWMLEKPCRMCVWRLWLFCVVATRIRRYQFQCLSYCYQWEHEMGRSWIFTWWIYGTDTSLWFNLMVLSVQFSSNVA